ncbi:hypothetical protein J3Q64DRAFT_1710891 [Phycomyces blakesleeanus]|uniref:DUF1772 domain-containing protein n=2 Tax=Phycomyces blakesleeanus TaxID=4837 RepID=A0A167KPR3_PHYB8|nr:hypothetical protein PHYBLDRAFT_188599 [Phycomyces blakesleeanus NRRL 1555(-)]OAD68597.1 hypothetical protein PHYBLDRAFT_188599 [Phycomyces blakesleeanus NRRL 1555(-)]|eukprot:XP_018286637.1 hypothetical protein PHYBLDRAFT_188599 [Phycomyces blakesleeanus NRRL 1555(-)]
MSDIQYARSIALIGSGIYAGLGMSVDMLSVPSIKVAANPTSVFRQVYKGGAKLALSSIIISSGAYFYHYYKTRESRSLYLGLLILSNAPYTKFFIMPTNNRLFALDDAVSHDIKTNHSTAVSPASLTSIYKTEQALALLNKWSKVQLYRTASGLVAFVVGILYI